MKPIRRLRNLGVAAAVAAAAFAPALPATAQSLGDTLAAAYNASNLLEQNRAVLRAADEDAAAALARLRPVVEFVTRFETSVRSTPGDNATASAGLRASVVLIDFGRGALAREAAREVVLATRQALVGVEQRVLFNAVVAFNDVRSAEATVRLRESNVGLIQRELQAARDRFDLGEITRTDVAIAEARLAGARSNLAAAQGDLAVAREAYRAATGAYPRQLREPPALPRLPASLEAAQGIARAGHPAIRQAQFEVAAAELQVEIAARGGHGQVTLGATATQSFTGIPGSGRSAGASVEYARPLFTGGRVSSDHRQAIARRDAARAGLHQTVVEVLREVGAAWSNLAVSRARIAASQQQIAAAETAYDGVRQEAQLGARTTLDVLNAEQELLDARAARIQALAGQQVAVYALLASMGLLTVEHLNLGIPTYDPEAYFRAVKDAPVTSIQGERLDRVLRSIGRQ